MITDLSSTYIAKLHVNSKPLYVKVLWKEDSVDLFHIQVFFEDKSWVGKFSNELAAKRRERLDETEEVYNTNVKEFLNGKSSSFVYNFIQHPDDITTASFIWKKRSEGEIIMHVLHGSVPLQCEEVPTSKDTLIDILLENNKKYISDIDVVNKANETLKEDLEQYKNKLEELIESKIAMESTLYGNFIQILNKKKERIQVLEEHINSL